MRIALALLAITTGGACSSDEPDTGPRLCTAGETMACVRPDGLTGVRICDSDFRWADACVESSDGSVPSALNAPEPPTLTPCPGGWSEQTTPYGADVCEPRPSGNLDCTEDEAHFLGASTCSRIGTACPADGLPDGLPADSRVFYVSTGSTGGDGSRAAPFGTLAGAISPAGRSDIIAIGAGRYDESSILRTGVTLWGACVGSTILTRSTYQMNEGVITAGGTGSLVRNVAIEDAERPAFFVGPGTEITARDVVVSNPALAGAIAFGGRIVLQDMRIRRARAHTDGSGGGALVVLDGEAEARRVVFEQNLDTSVIGDGPSSTVLEDAVISDTRPRSGAGERGHGLEINNGASLEGTRVLLQEHHHIAVLLNHADSHARLVDTVVRGTRERLSDGTGGIGVAAGLGTVALERAWLRDNREQAIVALDRARLDLVDVVLQETRIGTNDDLGRGIEAQFVADVRGQRISVDANHSVGVAAIGAGVMIDLDDLEVRATEARIDGAFGRGIEMVMGASFTGTRVHIADNHDIGVAAFQGGTIRLDDVEVVATNERPCVPGCFASGHGIGAYAGGIIALTNFLVRDNVLCGAHVATGGEIDLEDGTVQGHQIGACVQITGYDLSRLQRNVAYRDNGVGLDSTELPLPEATTPAPSM